MISQTTAYQLPDQGFTLLRWAHALARGRAAVVVEAAVDWVLANASNDRLHLDALRDMLGPRPNHTGSLDEAFLRPALARFLHQRRSQRRFTN